MVIGYLACSLNMSFSVWRGENNNAAACTSRAAAVTLAGPSGRVTFIAADIGYKILSVIDNNSSVEELTSIAAIV